MVGQGGQQGNGPNHGGGRPGLGSNNYHNPNQHMQEIMVPGPKVGLLIGKGGETIKQLQEQGGVKMVIIQDGPGMENEKPLRITGDYEKVERARQRVIEFLAELDSKSGGRGGKPGGFGGGGGPYRDDEMMNSFSSPGGNDGGGRNNHDDRQDDFRGNHGGGNYSTILRKPL